MKTKTNKWVEEKIRELDCTMTIKRLFGKLFVTNLQLKAVQPKEKE